MSLQHRVLKIKNTKSQISDNIELVKTAISQMEMGVELVITLQVPESKIIKLRGLYFSMVTELGKFAGYLSRHEQEEFKQQIKDHLKIDSLALITDNDELLIIIESLHQLASEHYNYIFKPNDPGIIIFDFKKS